jgi:NTE family protein
LRGRLLIITFRRPNAEKSCYTKDGVTIVRVPTGYASSLDRNMPIEILQRLFSDGYTSTKAALEKTGAGPTIPA